MREQFQRLNFHPKTLAMIAKANEIIEKLQALGYTLTLRQLYYQLVARDIIPNRQAEYKKLGETLNNARLAGLIDWDSIEDRTRSLKGIPHWPDPNSIVRDAADSYRIDKWVDQDVRIEVWVEKDALVGVLAKACNELDVPFFSCRGYTSQTALYDTSKRLLRHIRDGKEPIIIHLGDHDPSGIDMTRDIEDRLTMFVGQSLNINRIALNWDQIEEYHPPANPAKVTDSRFEAYERIHGDESWELDALDPQVVHALIQETVLQHRDEKKWEEQVKREEAERKALLKASNGWKDVQSFLKEFGTFQAIVDKEKRAVDLAVANALREKSSKKKTPKSKQ